jgi:hypothetical protein
MPARRIPPGGTRGTVYKEVARMRREDAWSLLGSGRYNGSVYLAGYAIECYLKFAICRRKDTIYLPAKLEVHDWDKLVDAAGLFSAINAQRAMAALYSGLADSWGPTIRYRTSTYAATQAKRLFNEMNQLYAFLIELVP